MCNWFTYFDCCKQAVKNTNSQSKRLGGKLEYAAHLTQPHDHLMVLRWADIWTLKAHKTWQMLSSHWFLTPEKTSLDHSMIFLVLLVKVVQKPANDFSYSFTWMQPFLRTGALQRRVSLARVLSKSVPSRWFSSSAGGFMAVLETSLFHWKQCLKEMQFSDLADAFMQSDLSCREKQSFCSVSIKVWWSSLVRFELPWF